MVGNFWRRQNRRRVTFSRIAAGLLLACVIVGCSEDGPDSLIEDSVTSTYQEREHAAQQEFAYRDLLNQNLSPTVWKHAEVSFRVPKPFRRQEGDPAASLKAVLGFTLPGVIGHWTALLPGKNDSPPQTGHVFVMSNQHLASAEATPPEEFHQRIGDLFNESRFSVLQPWTAKNVTGGHGLPFTSGSFLATVEGQPTQTRFRLFFMQQGLNQRRDAIKVAVLFVVPENGVLSGSRPEVDPQILSAETLLIALPQGDKPE